MTILEPTLYANGALRLTRHGAGKGGNVLVLEHPDGRTDQCEIADEKLSRVDGFLANINCGPISAFDVIRSVHAIPGSTRLAGSASSSKAPNFYHN